MENNYTVEEKNILRDLKERFRATFEQAAVGIAHVAPDGTWLRVNKKLCEIVGYTKEELLKKTFQEITHEDDLEKDLDHQRKMLDGVIGNYSTEKRYYRKNGNIIWIELTVSLVKDTKGNPKYFISVIKDISKRKKAEDNLHEYQCKLETMVAHRTAKLKKINEKLISEIKEKKETEQKLREVLNYSVNLFYSHGPDQVITYVSPQSKQFLGCEPKEARIRWTEFITDNPVNLKGIELTNKAIETGEAQPPYELELRKKNGDIIWVVVNEAPVVKEGKTVSIVGSLTDITERKLNEKALRKEQILLRTLIDNLPDVIYVKDKNCRKTVANLADVKNLGFEKESEVLGKNDFDLYTKEIAEKFFRDDQTIIKTGKPILNREEYLIDPDGKKKWLLTSKIPLYDEKGSISGLVGIGHDITEKKQAYEAIEKNEHLLRTSQRIAKLGHYSLDIQNGRWESSEILNEIFGIDETYQTTIEGWLQIVHPDYKDKMRAYFTNEVIGKRKPFDAEYKIKRISDGEMRWVHGVGELVFNKDKNLTRMIGTIQDITERKKAENELHKNQKQLSHAVDVAKLGPWEYDAIKDQFIFNDHFYKLFHTTVEEVGSYTMTPSEYANRFLFPEDVHIVAEEMKLAFESTDPNLHRQLEHRIKYPDGTAGYITVDFFITKDNHGRTIGTYGVNQNITERKKAEQQIIAAKEEAEEMNRLKSNFLANMSHELRTPLVGILGFSEFLCTDLINPELKEMAQAIYDSSKRLSETLNLILDLSRIETDKVAFMPEKFDAVAVSSEIINSFREFANKKEIYLKSTSESPEFIVNLDTRSFCSIINNLVNNAIKFTDIGGVTVNLSPDNIDGKDFVAIKVIDTGMGISKENQGVIFEEFRQVSEGLDRNFEGSGLGLSITRKLVEKLKGTLSVESELGKGSTFTVRLPLAENLPISTTNRINSEKEIKPILKSHLPSILVVDDDKNIRTIVKTYLGSNFNITFLENAHEAIKLAKQKKFDVILMDINLKKGIDGKEATKEIRKVNGYGNTPIVACTAYAMVGDKEEFLSSGCSHYISKPFSKEEILNLMDEVLR